MRLGRVAEYAALIRDQRTQRGMTQQQLADAIGVSRRWLVAFEQGDVPNPGFGTILAALKHLGLVLDVQRTRQTQEQDTRRS